jgi:hypothetical protein
VKRKNSEIFFLLNKHRIDIKMEELKVIDDKKKKLFVAK